MEVKTTKTFAEIPGYSIEWGNATWTKNEPVENKDWSIRNRYSNQDGRFNYAGSSEVPWEDFKSIKGNHFDNEELSEILKDISDLLLRTP